MRFLNDIDNLIQKGLNQIFIYGNGINDYFLYDFHIGIRELEDSLKLYFYECEKFDYFITIKDNKKITLYNKSLKIIAINKAFNIQKKVGGFGSNKKSSDVEIKKEIDTSNITEENKENVNSNDWSYLLENFDTNKLFIFIDDFEWQSGLYSIEQDTEFIKFLKDIQKSKQSITIVKMDDPEKLQEYGFDIEDKNDNLLYVSKPSKDEIKKSFRRVCYQNNINLKESELDEISSAFKANKRSLREIIKILKTTINSETKLIELNFFDNIIDSNIEEEASFDDVVLHSNIKENIYQEIESFLEDENAKKGFILYGPPGTGKTYIAKAIANEFKMSFFSPTLADLKGEYVGQSSKNVGNFFKEVRANAPAIVFLDEIDTIFRKRGGSNTDSYVEDMVNQFLVEIDGVNSAKSKIFIIGATNRLNEIDSAIKSRLSTKIHIGLPSKDEREQIIIKKLESFDFLNCDFKDEFLEKTENLSGRDLDNLIKSIQQRTDDLQRSDFFASLFHFEEQVKTEFREKMGGNLEIIEPSEKLSTIIGYKNIIAELEDEVDYIKMESEKKYELKRFGINQKRGTLLYGPPGNGKTTFASAIAGENDFYLIKVVSKDFASSFSEEILKKIDVIFESTIKLSKITQKKGIVLFFDEIDSLIGNRLDSVVRGSILKYFEDINGIKSEDSKIILMAATNHLNELDEASIRNGRFDNKLEIDYPNVEDRLKIFKKFFTNDKNILIDTNISEDIFNKIIANSNKISVVDLKNKKDEIKRKAFKDNSIHNNKLIIDKKHLL